jgi:hypothetical protein
METQQKKFEKETYMPYSQLKNLTKEEKSQWLFENDKTSKQYYLPGYPVQKGMEPPENFDKSMQKVIEQDIAYPTVSIKRIDVLIIVPIGTNDKVFSNIPPLIAGLLKMDKARGDTISVRKTPFPQELSLINQIKEPEVIFSIGKYAGFTILFLITLVIFFILARDFLGSLATIAQVLRPKMEVAIDQKTKESVSHDTTEQIYQEAGGDVKHLPGIQKQPVDFKKQPYKQAERKKHFDYVNENNLRKMAYLLKKETPENIAISVSYLDPRNASYLLSTLNPRVRTEVTNAIAHVVEATPDKVKGLDKTLYEKMDYLLGGSDFMLSVLDLCDNKTREQLIADIGTTDLALAEKLRSELFLFSDIINLTDTEVQKIIDHLDNDTLAMSLKEADQNIYDKFVSNMSKGAQTAVQQTMDLMGTQPDKKIYEAQNKIVSVVRQLINENIILKRVFKRVDAYTVEIADNDNKERPL